MIPAALAIALFSETGPLMTGPARITLKLLLGLLKPDEGRIYVNDVAIEGLDT